MTRRHMGLPGSWKSPEGGRARGAPFVPMTPASHRLERLALRLLTVADAVANRLYGQRFNPLYQSGTIVVALYLVLIVTGLWLILFYRVGAPWESVARITASPWTGNWVRGLHRYASDLAVVATAVHALRMFAQGRSWGARTLAWTSGVAAAPADHGLRVDRLRHGVGRLRPGPRAARAPGCSTRCRCSPSPLSRAFTGEQPLPSAFFFLNLFAHIGVPLAMGVVFWLHVKRLARPLLLPPAPAMWVAIGALTAGRRGLARCRWRRKPMRCALPAQVPADLFFAFWIPVVRSIGGRQTALIAMAIAVGVLALPRLVARGGPAPSPSTRGRRDLRGVPPVRTRLPLWRDHDGRARQPPVAARCPRRSGAVRELRHLRGVVPADGCRAARPIGTGSARARPRLSRPTPVRRPGEIVVVCCAHGAGNFAPELKRCRRRAVSHRLCRQPAHIGDRAPVARRHRRRARAGVPAARLLAPGRGRTGSSSVCTTHGKRSCRRA